MFIFHLLLIWETYFFMVLQLCVQQQCSLSGTGWAPVSCSRTLQQARHMLTHWFETWFFNWKAVPLFSLGHLTYCHAFMHSLILPIGFIFVRLSGGLEPIPACRVHKVEILSQGEHRGIKSLTLVPVGCSESPVLMTYCTVYFFWAVGGNWSILTKPHTMWRRGKLQMKKVTQLTVSAAKPYHPRVPADFPSTQP